MPHSVCARASADVAFCVVMPVVRHQAVTDSAVVLLIVQMHHILSIRPFQSRKQKTVAAAPEAQWQKLLGAGGWGGLPGQGLENSSV